MIGLLTSPVDAERQFIHRLRASYPLLLHRGGGRAMESCLRGASSKGEILVINRSLTSAPETHQEREGYFRQQILDILREMPARNRYVRMRLLLKPNCSCLVTLLVQKKEFKGLVFATVAVVKPERLDPVS